MSKFYVSVPSFGAQNIWTPMCTNLISGAWVKAKKCRSQKMFEDPGTRDFEDLSCDTGLGWKKIDWRKLNVDSYPLSY